MIRNWLLDKAADIVFFLYYRAVANHTVATGVVSVSKCYCGSLEWTAEHYGRITHKHGCPARRDSFCQSHRDACP